MGPNQYIQACYGESGLGQKYAFIKKSTIFTQSLRNLFEIGSEFNFQVM